MIAVRLICVGKMKEKFFIEATNEYIKRLGAYCSFELKEIPEERLPDKPSSKDIELALGREAENIKKEIPKGAYVISFCVEGKMQGSGEFSEFIFSLASKGISRICFIIGGSFGLSDEIKALSGFKLSVSKMTFPHHLFRVLAVEQIYRAFSIEAGSSYHK